MYKLIGCIALFCLAAVSAGLIEGYHHVVQEPVLAKVNTVVHSAPSAVSHQSFTRYHNEAVVSPFVAPIVKTTLHQTPLVSVVKAAPVLKTYAAKHVVHSVPVAHAAADVSVARAAPVFYTHPSPLVHAAPSSYTFHH